MTLKIKSLHARFAAELRGLDLTQPLPDAAFAEVRAAFEEHSVLVIPGPVLTDAQQIAFSERFGHVQTSFSGNLTGGSKLSRQSNIDPKSDAIMPPDHDRMIYQKGNRLWHSDSSYRASGSLCSILAAREVPPVGGNTEFVSTRNAWDDLPEDLKRRAERLRVVHSIGYSRDLATPGILTEAQKQEAPPAIHPLVQVNPVNGRRSLLIGAHASHIDGVSLEEGRALLADLLARATTPANVYSHGWRNGDVVIWDNRCILHRATPFESQRYRRWLERTTITGERPAA